MRSFDIWAWISIAIIALVLFSQRRRIENIEAKHKELEYQKNLAAQERAYDDAQAAGVHSAQEIPPPIYTHPSQESRDVPTWADIPRHKMPTWEEWGNIVKGGWEQGRIGLLKRQPVKTKYTLYALDTEDGGSQCRHCSGSYEFGHFPGCLYDADWKTDRRCQEIARYVQHLEAFLSVRPLDFGVEENKRQFEADKRMVHNYLGINE